MIHLIDSEVIPMIPIDSYFRYFESLMSSLLDAYFRTDKKMTEKVLTNKRPLWRNQSLIDVAGDIGLKSLIGKPGCQSVLAKRWKEVVFVNFFLYRKIMISILRCNFSDHPTYTFFL